MQPEQVLLSRRGSWLQAGPEPSKRSCSTPGGNMRRGQQLFFTWPARVSEQCLLVSTHTKSTQSSEDTWDAVFTLYPVWKQMMPAKSLLSSKAKGVAATLPPSAPKAGRACQEGDLHTTARQPPAPAPSAGHGAYPMFPPHTALEYFQGSADKRSEHHHPLTSPP